MFIGNAALLAVESGCLHLFLVLLVAFSVDRIFHRIFRQNGQIQSVNYGEHSL